MGTAEEQTPSKSSKATCSVQEIPTTMAPYPDWASPMQGYYATGSTAPYFASTVPPPASHPYMWGGQHPVMPPYGTPVHYPAMYPPGSVYAHPNIGTAAIATNGAQTEGKTLGVKDQPSGKKSKGDSDVGKEKAVETKKAVSGSGNEGVSQSAESGSEGSSDASDENNNQQELSANKKGSFDQMLVEAANNAQSSAVNVNSQASVPGKPIVPIPTTNLSIGMDLWNASPTGPARVGPSTGVSSTVVPAMLGHEGLMPDHWGQDERELKRQKRKQSNRESARRSRLRKQAECEELQRRVESLNDENSSLREELKKLSAECKKLTSENDSIKEELTRLCGPEAISGLGEKKPFGEGNS